jgi:membrane-associated HD superfamily phosphohydrolase
VYFILFIIKPNFFGEFISEFKSDKLSSKFYNFMMLERVLVGVGLVLLLNVNAEAVLPMIVFIAIGAFIFVKKPYKQQLHNYRQIANMTIATIVECVYLAFTMTNSSVRDTSKIFFLLPLFVCGLLIICVGYNGAAIVYSIYKFFK